MTSLDVDFDAARFLLGELPQCQGYGPLGCEADAPAPAIVFVDALKRHLCDRCAADVDGERIDAPHAAIVRGLTGIARGEGGRS